MRSSAFDFFQQDSRGLGDGGLAGVEQDGGGEAAGAYLPREGAGFLMLVA